MLERFQAYIKANDLVRLSDKILLAVSGGVDSVCMAHLFHQAGYTFDIAHCNFKLRGSESDKDQDFVNRLSKKYSCRFYLKVFDTLAYSQTNNLSIQMAARELRYEWFKELATQNNFSYVAVGHNRNDIVETMLINLIRGTGLKGLRGIMPKREHIIRPLLFASRTEIMNYAREENIRYREDSSNEETKYQRNLIRKKVLPILEQINPKYLETMIEEGEIFQSVDTLYRNEIENIRRIITIPGAGIIYSIPKMVSVRLSAPVLYDLISCYGFTYTDSKNLLKVLTSEPGKRFISDRYELLKDRKTIVIEERNKQKGKHEYFIEKNTLEFLEPVTLKISKYPNDKHFRIPISSKKAVLDYDKLQFPLKLRHWKKGDFFFPLGLTGRKKLSDFFIDHKISRLEKERIWLLISGNDIIWVIDHQIDDRYKITPDTQNIIQFELMD
jgi:tRNA(Ile)-lysidine synthase